MEELPIACSLEANDLKDRLAQIEAIGADALLGHRRVEGVHRLRFRAEPSVRTRLEAVVAAEAHCCPFLKMELEDGGRELTLSIAAPAAAEPVAAELAAAFTGGIS